MSRSSALASGTVRSASPLARAASSRGEPSWHRDALLLIAVWSVPALLSCVETYLFNALENHPASWSRIIAMVLPGWYLWAALTPVIFSLSRRYPLARGRLPRSVSMHLLVCFACTVLYGLVYTLASRATAAVPSRWSFDAHWLRITLSWMPISFLLYWAIVCVAHWIAGTQRERRRESERSAMAAQLAQAELDALRMQLHPHFLFNTLNTIAVLIRERDTAVAVRLVTQLGDVLRQVIRGSRSHETSLQQEVTFLGTYLDIEQVRFAGALAVRWAIPNNLLQATVPVLILQPLVENALRHGIAHREEGGSLEIGARRDGDTLVLWVTDNGPGPGVDDVDLGLAASGGDGVGLANTRKRLAQLHPGASSFHLFRVADGGDGGGGARAEVRMPFVRWPAPEGAVGGESLPAAWREEVAR